MNILTDTNLQNVLIRRGVSSVGTKINCRRELIGLYQFHEKKNPFLFIVFVRSHRPGPACIGVLRIIALFIVCVSGSF